jgi:hypothetical protein
MTLDEWNRVPHRVEWDLDEDDGWEDDGPTSCRDIISSSDYDFYYSGLKVRDQFCKNSNCRNE